MIRSFFKFLFLSIFCLLLMGISVVYGFSSFFVPKDIDTNLTPDAASQIYDDQEQVIFTTLSEERRVPVNFEDIPANTRNAFIAIEDNRFYEHSGIDLRGTARAIVSTLSGQEVQGGSTITQQLAKNAFLTQERTITRKIKEAFIAKELERRYTKDEILTMYLNQIYFGNSTYGIESAALYYFGKHVGQLSIAQSASLAAIPKSPNYYNPFENPEENKSRQELVIDQMVKYNFISAEEGAQAKAEDIKLMQDHNKEVNLRGYFYDMITQEIIDKFGADALYKGGLKIYTTLDLDMQIAAERAIRHLPNFYKDDNDLMQPQVALACIEPDTGYIKAIIGGRGTDKFNRAILATRQPGSSFKPFVYLTAMQNGFTPASVVEDKKETYGKDWTPTNSDMKEHGKVSLRTALIRSLNISTVKIANKIGMDGIISNAEKMGISTLVTEGNINDGNLSTALGGLTKGVIPLEMASAYGVLASNGYLAKPIAITKVVDRTGNVLMESKQSVRRVMDAKSCYLVTNMLQDVLTRGTAAVTNIGAPAAGKTGTTDNYVDAWFVGYTPHLSTAVWVGHDSTTNAESLPKMYGSDAPLAIWEEFMTAAAAKTAKTNFTNPGVKIPPEPKIVQDPPKNAKQTVSNNKSNSSTIKPSVSNVPNGALPSVSNKPIKK